MDWLENGLDVLRHEARDASKATRTWRHHNSLMRRAREHIEHCGGDWTDFAGILSDEFARLLRL